MAEAAQNEQMEGYSEAVKSGLYAKKSGLVGKYDNVRRYWEDEITRQMIRPHLHGLLERCRNSVRRLRIMDLGCGSADGYELLAGIRHRDADLQTIEIDMLSPEVLGQYKGIELNADLIEQAREIYHRNPKMIFEQADFTEGLPLGKNEKPYDLYFCSYGTCSHHNEDETIIALLAEIAQRTDDYCIVVCDWLGRYSYEWQTLWTHDLSENRNMDYVVSYIYEKAERETRRDQLQHLYLRLMSRPEMDAIITEASERAGAAIRPLVCFDRSTFTGRHMDTAEHNPHAQPIRAAVNSLHEVNVRTDLGTLAVDYVPKPGFDFLNGYFEHLQMCWNTLIHHVEVLLQAYDEDDRRFKEPVPPVPASYPAPLRETMARMESVVEGIGWLKIGLPRENIIEPQLGYALRHLITKLQQGQGCSHSLGAIFEIDKTADNAAKAR